MNSKDFASAPVVVSFPDVALAEEGGDVAFAFGLDGVVDLLLEELVVGRALDGPEDAGEVATSR